MVEGETIRNNQNYYYQKGIIPANTRRLLNVCSMLGQRRRRWANNEQALSERLLLAGILLCKMCS